MADARDLRLHALHGPVRDMLLQGHVVGRDERGNVVFLHVTDVRTALRALEISERFDQYQLEEYRPAVAAWRAEMAAWKVEVARARVNGQQLPKAPPMPRPIHIRAHVVERALRECE